MNDPEVTMLDALPNSNFIAYRKALEAASIALALVTRVPAPLESLADQVIRSAASVPANLAEGQGRTVSEPGTAEGDSSPLTDKIAAVPGTVSSVPVRMWPIFSTVPGTVGTIPIRS